MFLNLCLRLCLRSKGRFKSWFLITLRFCHGDVFLVLGLCPLRFCLWFRPRLVELDGTTEPCPWDAWISNIKRLNSQVTRWNRPWFVVI